MCIVQSHRTTAIWLLLIDINILNRSLWTNRCRHYYSFTTRISVQSFNTSSRPVYCPPTQFLPITFSSVTCRSVRHHRHHQYINCTGNASPLFIPDFTVSWNFLFLKRETLTMLQLEAQDETLSSLKIAARSTVLDSTFVCLFSIVNSIEMLFF